MTSLRKRAPSRKAAKPKKERVQVALSNEEAQGWFLTYPQCPLELQDAAQRILDLPGFPELKEWLIVRELHQDGNPHIHAYLNYSRKVAWSDTRWNLHTLGKVYHGSYEKVKGAGWASNYLMKGKKEEEKGTSWVSNFDPFSHARKKGKNNVDLLESCPIEAMRMGKVAALNYQKLVLNQQLWKLHTAPKLPAPEGFIPNRLGLNMPYVLDDKQAHYWLWSTSPNTGKTTFLQELSKFHECIFYNYREPYQKVQEHTQFVLFDEYTRERVTVEDLNAMCDGFYQWPVKFGQPVKTTQKAVIIVTGNCHPSDIYSDSKMPYIEARFHIIELTKVFVPPKKIL